MKNKQKDLEVTAGQRLFEEQMVAIKHEGLCVTQRLFSLFMAGNCLQYVEVILSAH